MKIIFLLKILLLVKQPLENGIKKAIIQNINALYVDKNQYGKERN